MSEQSKSFTLIELLVVISIVGLLSSIVLVSLEGGEQRATTGKAMEFSHTVRVSLGADLVGEWKLDEGTGTTTKDSSGNNNTGTLVNNPQWVDGIFGKALKFSGADNYVGFNNQITLNRYGATLEWWANPMNTASTGFFSISNATSGSYNSHLEMRTTQIWGETDQNCNDVLFNVAKKEGWRHFVMIFENAKAYIYVNAEFLGESTSYGGITCTGPAATQLLNDMTLRYIGIKTAYSPSFNGFIDEVKFYNRALSSTEIQKLYAKGVARHNLVLK